MALTLVFLPEGAPVLELELRPGFELSQCYRAANDRLLGRFHYGPAGGDIPGTTLSCMTAADVAAVMGMIRFGETSRCLADILRRGRVYPHRDPEPAGGRYTDHVLGVVLGGVNGRVIAGYAAAAGHPLEDQIRTMLHRLFPGGVRG